MSAVIPKTIKSIIYRSKIVLFNGINYGKILASTLVLFVEIETFLENLKIAMPKFSENSFR